MGNCQAIDDNASLVIQHPGGRAEKHYWPLSATEIMNTNPGHYVALLLTTTLNSSSAAAASTNNVPPVQRITRIKLLKPTDTLVLGHVYRLVTAQEVMKGLWAKRHSHMKQKQQQQQSSSSSSGPVKKHEKLIAQKSTTSDSSNRRRVNVGRSEQHERRHRSSSAGGGGGGGRCKAWQPSLLSISEAAGVST